MNKKAYIAAGMACIAGCVICITTAFGHPPSRDLAQAVDLPDTVQTEPETTEETTHQSPIDFDSLHTQNPEIYAWIDIPGTEISYPIAQHSEDDSYYLSHDVHGNSAAEGTLFTESKYNGTQFADKLTVVYGHNMKDQSMFGTLQSTYSDTDNFKNLNQINIYLPDRELSFEIVAAVPYDNRHILYNYDLITQQSRDMFAYSINSVRAIGANLAQDPFELEENDQVLVLSTCQGSDHSARYIVVAVRKA